MLLRSSAEGVAKPEALAVAKPGRRISVFLTGYYVTLAALPP